MLYAYKYTLPCLYVLTVLMLLIYWWCGDTAARRQRLRRKHGSGRNRWYFRNSFTRRVYKSSWVYFNKNALRLNYGATIYPHRLLVVTSAVLCLLSLLASWFAFSAKWAVHGEVNVLF